MLVSEALSCLGSKRTIWIDDQFNEAPPEKLADLLLNGWEVAVQCNFDELKAILPKAEYGADAVRVELVEKLTELTPRRRNEMQAAVLVRETMEGAIPSRELSEPTIDKICTLLGVHTEDRWTFDNAEGGLARLCADGDADVSYIVDLNDAGRSVTRGLEILKLLRDEKSKGTAFILTHDAAAKGEATKEAELRGALVEDENELSIPICVIAKQRLFELEDDRDIEETLRISIKRAGLRRSLSEVVFRAQSTVHAAFGSAAAGLLRVPPEQLEAYVFERGYKEGVSELHVVERVLTSHIAQELRMFFGTDRDVIISTRRLRALRAIELKAVPTDPDPNLAAFRLAEVWESEELINSALAPIACGDVFEADSHENSVKNIVRKFILLAQPCDIALRPEGKERSQKTAFLVPLTKVKGKVTSEKNAKLPLLPCKLGEDHWACDFRNATTIKTAILDLASFRTDGRVRVDENQEPPIDLLEAQHRIYQKRTAPLSKAIQFAQTTGDNIALQLCFSAEGDFKHFHFGVLHEGSAEDKGRKIPALPRRVTWHLRRSGRVRMPYSVALLDQYLGIMSRQVFDLDYMNPGFGDGTQPRPEEGSQTLESDGPQGAAEIGSASAK
jgi:hypothetical protein